MKKKLSISAASSIVYGCDLLPVRVQRQAVARFAILLHLLENDALGLIDGLDELVGLAARNVGARVVDVGNLHKVVPL